MKPAQAVGVLVSTAVFVTVCACSTLLWLSGMSVFWAWPAVLAAIISVASNPSSLGSSLSYMCAFAHQRQLTSTFLTIGAINIRRLHIQNIAIQTTGQSGPEVNLDVGSIRILLRIKRGSPVHVLVSNVTVGMSIGKTESNDPISNVQVRPNGKKTKGSKSSSIDLLLWLCRFVQLSVDSFNVEYAMYTTDNNKRQGGETTCVGAWSMLLSGFVLRVTGVSSSPHKQLGFASSSGGRVGGGSGNNRALLLLNNPVEEKTKKQRHNRGESKDDQDTMALDSDDSLSRIDVAFRSLCVSVRAAESLQSPVAHQLISVRKMRANMEVKLLEKDHMATGNDVSETDDGRVDVSHNRAVDDCCQLPGSSGGINGHVQHRQTILLQSMYTDTNSVKTFMCPLRAEAISRLLAEAEANSIMKRKRTKQQQKQLAKHIRTKQASGTTTVRALLFPPLVWSNPWASTRHRSNIGTGGMEDASTQGSIDVQGMAKRGRVMRVDSEGDTGWECHSCSFINPTSEMACQVCKTYASGMDEDDIKRNRAQTGDSSADHMDDETVEHDDAVDEEEDDVLSQNGEAQSDAKHRLSIVLAATALVPLESFIKVETCCFTISTSPGDLSNGDQSEMSKQTKEADRKLKAASNKKTNAAVRMRFVSCVNVSSRTTRSHMLRVLPSAPDDCKVATLGVCVELIDPMLTLEPINETIPRPPMTLVSSRGCVLQVAANSVCWHAINVGMKKSGNSNHKFPDNSKNAGFAKGLNALASDNNTQSRGSNLDGREGLDSTQAAGIRTRSFLKRSVTSSSSSSSSSSPNNHREVHRHLLNVAGGFTMDAFETYYKLDVVKSLCQLTDSLADTVTQCSVVQQQALRACFISISKPHVSAGDEVSIGGVSAQSASSSNDFSDSNTNSTSDVIVTVPPVSSLPLLVAHDLYVTQSFSFGVSVGEICVKATPDVRKVPYQECFRKLDVESLEGFRLAVNFQQVHLSISVNTPDCELLRNGQSGGGAVPNGRRMSFAQQRSSNSTADTVPVSALGFEEMLICTVETAMAAAGVHCASEYASEPSVGDMHQKWKGLSIGAELSDLYISSTSASSYQNSSGRSTTHPRRVLKQQTKTTLFAVPQLQASAFPSLPPSQTYQHSISPSNDGNTQMVEGGTIGMDLSVNIHDTRVVAGSVAVFRVLKLADDCRDAVSNRLGSSLSRFALARHDATVERKTLRAEALRMDSSTTATANQNSDAWLLLYDEGRDVRDITGRRMVVPLWKPPKRNRKQQKQSSDERNKGAYQLNTVHLDLRRFVFRHPFAKDFCGYLHAPHVQLTLSDSLTSRSITVYGGTLSLGMPPTDSPKVTSCWKGGATATAGPAVHVLMHISRLRVNASAPTLASGPCVQVDCSDLVLTANQHVILGEAMTRFLQERKALARILELLPSALAGPSGLSTRHTKIHSSEPSDLAGNRTGVATLELRVTGLRVRVLEPLAKGEYAVHADAPLLDVTMDEVLMDMQVDIAAGSRDRLIAKVHELDDRDVPNSVYSHGFSYVQGCDVTQLVVRRMTVQLRTFTPLLYIERLQHPETPRQVNSSHMSVNANDERDSRHIQQQGGGCAVVFAAVNGTKACEKYVDVAVGGDDDLVVHMRSVSVPVKCYMDAPAFHVTFMRASYGNFLGASIHTLTTTLIRILPAPSSSSPSLSHGSPSSGTESFRESASTSDAPRKLMWWDKIRYMLHGNFGLTARELRIELASAPPWVKHERVVLCAEHAFVIKSEDADDEKYGESEHDSNVTWRYADSVDTSDADTCQTKGPVIFHAFEIMAHNLRVALEMDDVGADFRAKGVRAGTRRGSKNNNSNKTMMATSASSLSFASAKNSETDWPSNFEFLLLHLPTFRCVLGLDWHGYTNSSHIEKTGNYSPKTHNISGTGPDSHIHSTRELQSYIHNHYCELHHSYATKISDVSDMFRLFRAYGVDVSLDLTASASAETSARDVDESTALHPSLTLCWSVCTYVVRFLRHEKQFRPVPSSALQKDSLVGGSHTTTQEEGEGMLGGVEPVLPLQLVHSLRLTINMERPRAMWWDGPQSIAALLFYADSLSLAWHGQGVVKFVHVQQQQQSDSNAGSSEISSASSRVVASVSGVDGDVMSGIIIQRGGNHVHEIRVRGMCLECPALLGHFVERVGNVEYLSEIYTQRVAAMRVTNDQNGDDVLRQHEEQDSAAEFAQEEDEDGYSDDGEEQVSRTWPKGSGVKMNGDASGCGSAPMDAFLLPPWLLNEQFPANYDKKHEPFVVAPAIKYVQGVFAPEYTPSFLPRTVIASSNSNVSGGTKPQTHADVAMNNAMKVSASMSALHGQTDGKEKDGTGSKEHMRRRSHDQQALSKDMCRFADSGGEDEQERTKAGQRFSFDHAGHVHAESKSADKSPPPSSPKNRKANKAAPSGAKKGLKRRQSALVAAPSGTPQLTIDELRLLWTLDVRNALYMVTGSVSFALDELKIDINEPCTRAAVVLDEDTGKVGVLLPLELSPSPDPEAERSSGATSGGRQTKMRDGQQGVDKPVGLVVQLRWPQVNLMAGKGMTLMTAKEVDIEMLSHVHDADSTTLDSNRQQVVENETRVQVFGTKVFAGPTDVDVASKYHWVPSQRPSVVPLCVVPVSSRRGFQLPVSTSSSPISTSKKHKQEAVGKYSASTLHSPSSVTPSPLAVLLETNKSTRRRGQTAQDENGELLHLNDLVGATETWEKCPLRMLSRGQWPVANTSSAEGGGGYSGTTKASRAGRQGIRHRHTRSLDSSMLDDSDDDDDDDEASSSVADDHGVLKCILQDGALYFNDVTTSDPSGGTPQQELNMHIPQLNLRMSSQEFFVTLGVIRDLLLVAPPPEYVRLYSGVDASRRRKERRWESFADPQGIGSLTSQFRRSGRDTKTLRLLVDQFLDRLSQDGEDRIIRNLRYQFDHVGLTLLGDNPAAPEPGQGRIHSDNFERVLISCIGLEGTHAFMTKGGTSVHVRAQDISLLDSSPGSQAMQFDDEEDIGQVLYGHCLENTYHQESQAPMLEFVAVTASPLVVAEYRVTTYESLQLRLFPATDHLIRVRLTQTIASFLSRYFATEDDEVSAAPPPSASVTVVHNAPRHAENEATRGLTSVSSITSAASAVGAGSSTAVSVGDTSPRDGAVGKRSSTFGGYNTQRLKNKFYGRTSGGLGGLGGGGGSNASMVGATGAASSPTKPSTVRTEKEGSWVGEGQEEREDDEEDDGGFGSAFESNGPEDSPRAGDAAVVELDSESESDTDLEFLLRRDEHQHHLAHGDHKKSRSRRGRRRRSKSALQVSTTQGLISPSRDVSPSNSPRNSIPDDIYESEHHHRYTSTPPSALPPRLRDSEFDNDTDADTDLPEQDDKHGHDHHARRPSTAESIKSDASSMTMGDETGTRAGRLLSPRSPSRSSRDRSRQNSRSQSPAPMTRKQTLGSPSDNSQFFFQKAHRARDVVYSGWMSKRSKSLVVWSSGRVRRNYFIIRAKQPHATKSSSTSVKQPFDSLASVCDAVVLEYYRNELEVRIKLPPRGSFRVCDVVGLRFSRDSSAPKNALDILVRTADTVPQGTTPNHSQHSPKSTSGTSTDWGASDSKMSEASSPGSEAGDGEEEDGSATPKGYGRSVATHTFSCEPSVQSGSFEDATLDLVTVLTTIIECRANAAAASRSGDGSNGDEDSDSDNDGDNVKHIDVILSKLLTEQLESKRYVDRKASIQKVITGSLEERRQRLVSSEGTSGRERRHSLTPAPSSSATMGASGASGGGVGSRQYQVTAQPSKAYTVSAREEDEMPVVHDLIYFKQAVIGEFKVLLSCQGFTINVNRRTASCPQISFDSKVSTWPQFVRRVRRRIIIKVIPSLIKWQKQKPKISNVKNQMAGAFQDVAGISAGMAGAGKEMARRAQARAQAEVPAAKSLSKNVGRMLRGALFGRNNTHAAIDRGDAQTRQTHATSAGSAMSGVSTESSVGPAPSAADVGVAGGNGYIGGRIGSGSVDEVYEREEGGEEDDTNDEDEDEDRGGGDGDVELEQAEEAQGGGGGSREEDELTENTIRVMLARHV